jgi:hypothetical protein
VPTTTLYSTISASRRVVKSVDEELETLYAMLVSLGATKMMARRLMQRFPDHAPACQAIVDFTTDGEGDMRGAIDQLVERPTRRWRGGAT